MVLARSLGVLFGLCWILAGCAVSTRLAPTTPLPQSSITSAPEMFLINTPLPPSSITPVPERDLSLLTDVSPTPSASITSVLEQDLSLSNYPRLFARDVTIVVGENASQVELESAQMIAVGLKKLNGSESVIIEDNRLEEADKTGHDLILIGTPGSNAVLEEIYHYTGTTKVTSENPGKYKGLLEILKNPWNPEYTLLIVAGSDEMGVKAGTAELTHYQEFHESLMIVDWEDSRKTTPTNFCKIGANLDLLLTLRGDGQFPEEMREIIKKDTVSVSINFSHELDAAEIQFIEELGIKFNRLDGEVAHSGTIYGADVPWDKLKDLVAIKSVIRVESAWQPGLQSPDY